MDSHCQFPILLLPTIQHWSAMLTWWQVEIQTIYIPLLVSWRTVTVGLDGNFDFVAAYGCYGKFNLYILVTIYDTAARMLTSTYHKVIPRTCSCLLRYLHIADVRYGLLHPETYLGLGWYFSRVRKKSLYVQGVGMRREFRYDSDCWPNSVSQQTTKE